MRLGMRGIISEASIECQLAGCTLSNSIHGSGYRVGFIS